MKKLLKSTILLATVFASLLFVNCEKNEHISENLEKNNSKKIIIKSLNKTDIQNNTRLFNNIKELELNSRKISSSNNREVYIEEHDFTINTRNAKYIDNGSIVSYTFSITRDNDSGILENLLMVDDGNSNYRTFLVQYDFTEEERIALAYGEMIDAEGRANFTEIEGNSIPETIFNNSSSRINGDCISVPSYEYMEGNSCASGQHSVHDGDSCIYWGGIGMATTGGYVLTMETICGEGGGGPSSDGSTGSTNGGGGTGDSTPITTPTEPISEYEFVSRCLNTDNFDLLSLLQGSPRQNNGVTGDLSDFIEFNGCDQDFLLELLDDYLDGECVAIPNNYEFTDEENQDLNTYMGLNDENVVQTPYDHQNIKTTYIQKLNNNDKQGAIEHIINSYNMETFGSLDISGYNYQLNFTSSSYEGLTTTHVLNGGVLESIIVVPQGFIDNDNEFHYITRAIKHELYHVLQVNTNSSLTHELREFFAYYKTLYGWKELPESSNSRKSFYAQKIAEAYYQMPTSHQEEPTVKTKWEALLKNYKFKSINNSCPND